MICKIGILDDEPLVRESIRTKLRLVDPTCEIVYVHEDGQQLLKLLREAPVQPVDLMVVDILMPKMTGLDFIREAKPLWPNMQFLIVSGYNDFTYARTAIQLGVEDYLMKPVVTDELQVTLERIKAKLQANEAAEIAELHHELTMWLQQRGQSALGAAAERYLQAKLAARPQLYLMLTGNFGTAAARSSLAEATRDALTLPLHVGSAQPVMLYLHPSSHFADKLLAHAANEPTVTIVHAPTVHRPELLLRLVTSGLQLLRNRLVLDAHTIVAYSLPTEDHALPLAESPAPENSLMLQLRHEHRQEAALGLLKQLLAKPLPQVIKEQAFRQFMQQFHHMDVEQEWLQSFQRSPEFTDACLELIRSIHQEAGPVTGKEILRQVLADIQKYAALRRTLQDYANAYDIHPNHLARLIKKELNTTFVEHVTRIRMEQAKELLLQGKQTVADIALAVGYEDARYFSQVFRRQFGQTPSAFRE